MHKYRRLGLFLGLILVMIVSLFGTLLILEESLYVVSSPKIPGSASSVVVFQVLVSDRVSVHVGSGVSFQVLRRVGDGIAKSK